MNPFTERYLKYCSAYWREIVGQTSGPLSEFLAPILPEVYRRSGSLLIFPAKDGIVALCFERGFRAPDPTFQTWLHEGAKEEGPHASIVTCSHSNILTVAQWVQVFTGNSIKIRNTGDAPPANIFVSNFPSFPGVVVSDPSSGVVSPAALLEINNTSPGEMGLSLRDISLQEVGKDEIIRPFWWMQMDVFEDGALKKLTAKQGQLQASREILALRAAKNLGLKPKAVASDPISPTIEGLEAVAREFEVLLNSESLEGPLQSFIKDHPMLLAPDVIRCISQPQFGSEHKPDFLILKPGPGVQDVECILVEIEPASFEVFTLSGDTTAKVNHALGQVSDWRAWLRSNATYAQQSLEVPNLHSDCRAIVVIGRGNRFTAEQKKRFENLNLVQQRTEVLTYDDLLIRMRSLIENLRRSADRFAGAMQTRAE